MNRSPLFYPLSRSNDSDGGGAADLQTDVMRFMAIISLCLVAIFALVQSIPLDPAAEDAVMVEAEQVLESVPPEPVEPVPEKITEIKMTRPVPARTIVHSDPVALRRPEPLRAQKSDPAPARVENDVAVADAAPSEEGFTLRFETDAALTRLVARQVVGFYAISSDNTLRMNVAGDEISFWPASTPGQFHEMDRSTVPLEVLSAFGKGNEMNDVKWAVTLPANMSSELNSYLSSARGGSLVIASNAQIALQ
jgi:hypothetical protein